MENRTVEPKRKRNILITGIGMFAAAICIPALFLGMMHLPTDFNMVFPPLVLSYAYVFLCFITLVWGGVQVFPELSCKKSVSFFSFYG